MLKKYSNKINSSGGLISAGLIFFVVFFAFFYKKIIALFSSPSDKINEQKISTIDNIIVGDNATLSTTQAQIIADSLYNALDRFNDDEKLVYANFDKIKNADDMKMVYKAFGLRSYLLGTGANYLGTKMTLVEWLENDLSSSELQKIQFKLNWI